MNAEHFWPISDTAQQLSALGFIDGRPESFREDFREWLIENWHIWMAFNREVEKVRRLGRTHYSARTIIHYLRHETALYETSGEWKINDHFSPDLGRLWECHHPDKAGFFEKRVRSARGTGMAERSSSL